MSRLHQDLLHHVQRPQALPGKPLEEEQTLIDFVELVLALCEKKQTVDQKELNRNQSRVQSSSFFMVFQTMVHPNGRSLALFNSTTEEPDA